MPLLSRFRALPVPGIEADLTLALGTLADYGALASHHYKSARPATAARVLVLRHHRPTVVGRYLRRPSQPQLVGVVVESRPCLSCALRDYALPERYRGLDPLARGRLLNREIRCLSRVIVHPQWRGLGLAVRLVRAALDSATTPYTEALAAMGHVHPVFAQAGMTAYHRPPHPGDLRLLAALAHAGVAPADLARLPATLRKLPQLPAAARALITRELQRWHTRHGHHALARTADPRPLLAAAYPCLLAPPVYYLHRNPCAALGLPA